MGIDMLCDILGKAPLFGLLTDERRQAVWLIEIKTTKLPHPEMLGSLVEDDHEQGGQTGDKVKVHEDGTIEVG